MELLSGLKIHLKREFGLFGFIITRLLCTYTAGQKYLNFSSYKDKAWMFSPHSVYNIDDIYCTCRESECMRNKAPPKLNDK